MTMKVCVIVVAIVCAGFIEAAAQTGKGNFLIGGSINFFQDKTEGPPPGTTGFISTNAIFSFNPTVGYFVVNNFLVGGQASVSHGWNSSNKQAKDNVYSIGPMLRYYFPFGKFAAFPELAAGYNFESQRYGTIGLPNDASSTAKTKYTSVRAGAGVAWFAAPNIGIEGIVAYRQNNFSSKNDITHGSESWLYFNVGLQFYLNRNK